MVEMFAPLKKPCHLTTGLGRCTTTTFGAISKGNADSIEIRLILDIINFFKAFNSHRDFLK